MSIAVDGFLYQLQVQPNIQWNLKYCQLRNATLLSFQPVNNVMLIETIPCLTGFNVKCNNATEYAAFSFSLVSNSGEIVFAGVNEETTQYWVNALQAATRRQPSLEPTPSPPFATLPQSRAVFNPSPLPYPFSTLSFDCCQGISKIVDEWLNKKAETDPIRDAFTEFEEVLQYRYSAKSRTITHLFYATINRQFDKMRTLVTSPEFTHKDRYKKTQFEYFTTVELCLFLCVIMGELEGARVLVAGGARFDPEHHMGGFTPLLLAVAEGKRDLACLIARHSPAESEVLDILGKPENGEYFQNEYLDNIAQLLQITRPCWDPHVYPLPLPPTPTGAPLSPLSPLPPLSPISPISPISPVASHEPFMPLFPTSHCPDTFMAELEADLDLGLELELQLQQELDLPPELGLQPELGLRPELGLQSELILPSEPKQEPQQQEPEPEARFPEPRLLRLATFYKIPRNTILPVIASLLRSAPNYTAMPPISTHSLQQTVVTETDVLRLLTLSGLKPNTRHKLHYTVKKMKNMQSFYVKEQGAVAMADEKGVAKWHLFSHNAGTVEMYAYNSEFVYEKFICVLNSRIKKLPGDLNMELEVKPICPTPTN